MRLPILLDDAPTNGIPVRAVLNPMAPCGAVSNRLVGPVGSLKRLTKTKRQVMSLGTILIILLVLALIGVLPTWGYSTSWGYAPGGIVGLLLVIVIILALLGRL